MSSNRRSRTYFMCMICLDDLGPVEENDYIIATPCSHAFHRNCLFRWLIDCPRAASRSQVGTCPNCQSFITMDTCHQIFLSEEEASAEARELYREDIRVRQELAQVQAELRETKKRYDQLQNRYNSVVAPAPFHTLRIMDGVSVVDTVRVIPRLTPFRAAVPPIWRTSTPVVAVPRVPHTHFLTVNVPPSSIPLVLVIRDYLSPQQQTTAGPRF